MKPIRVYYLHQANRYYFVLLINLFINWLIKYQADYIFVKIDFILPCFSPLVHWTSLETMCNSQRNNLQYNRAKRKHLFETFLTANISLVLFSNLFSVKKLDFSMTIILSIIKNFGEMTISVIAYRRNCSLNMQHL